MIPHLSTTLLSARADGSPPDPALPVLVLGPSLGTGVKALWGPAVEYLAPFYTLVGWDLPGHGSGAPSEGPFTMAELAQGVVDALGRLEGEHSIPGDVPTLYAGVSIGGATGLQLALDHPGAFSAIAAICTAAKIGTPEAWEERAELVERAGTPTQVVGSAQRWFAPGFIEANPAVSTDLLHTLQDADRHSYAAASRALAGFDLRGSLGLIADPILALNGELDTVCPPSDAEATASGVVHGTDVALPGVAHLAPAEDPAATARALVAFFSGALDEAAAR